MVLFAWLAAAASAAVDLNRASASELDALPGLGPVKAQAIVQWRGEHGPCRALEDLLEVPGVGAATIGMLRGRAYCGAGRGSTGSASAEGVSAAPIARPLHVDVNRATADQLAELPGLTPERAQAIVAERTRNGPFASCADLVRVPGIGPATVANLGPTCVARPLP
jgi:competence protein ComEA